MDMKGSKSGLLLLHTYNLKSIGIGSVGSGRRFSVKRTGG